MATYRTRIPIGGGKCGVFVWPDNVFEALRLAFRCVFKSQTTCFYMAVPTEWADKNLKKAETGL